MAPPQGVHKTVVFWTYERRPGRAERFRLGGSKEGVKMRGTGKSVGYEGRHQMVLIPIYSLSVATY